MSLTLRALGCAALLLSAGCDDIPPLAPSSVAGVYALISVNGSPLPAELSAGPTDEWAILADTMRLELDGSLEGRKCERRTDFVLDSSTEICRDYVGGYVVRSRTIEINFGCAPGQICAMVALPPLKAWREGDDLLFRYGDDVFHRYRRIE